VHPSASARRSPFPAQLVTVTKQAAAHGFWRENAGCCQSVWWAVIWTWAGSWATLRAGRRNSNGHQSAVILARPGIFDLGIMVRETGNDGEGEKRR